MKLHRDFRIMRGRRVLAGTAVVLLPVWANAASGASEKPFEINVTNDLTITSGEPQIAVDPTNPRNVAIVEFGTGSVKRPAYAFNPVILADLLQDVEGAMANTGRVMLSKDGGNHWAQPGPPPAYDPNASPRTGGGDPFIAYGPDGTLYVGDEAGPAPKPDPSSSAKTTYQIYAELLPRSNVTVVASRDGGKSFGAPQSAGTPVDRPWIAVDRTTGTVYTVSSGNYNPTTKAHNVPGDGAPNDRWLVAWKPRLAGKSEPRRLGGPDFSASGGSTITAAHGVLATTFLIGAPGPGGFTGGQPAPVPIPDSLKSVLTDGTTSCSRQAPCLFFQTSTDQGEHWMRHHVPVAGGFSGSANVTADPGRPGRYAISVLNSARTNLLILVTDDSGATWSGPVTVPETATGVDFKYWLDYGPTGVLGLVWKKQRDDLTPPSPPPSGPPEVAFRSALAPAFDVYSAISCDGGNSWFAPVRMNAETSPAGPAGNDDLSYISLDAKYAHMVWGDRRMLSKVTNVPGASGGLQSYYGRLPFSAVSNGAACGRK
jgi:hypothetical protein